MANSPNQTTETSYSYPKGLRMDVSPDGVSWIDAGVMADGVSWTHNYDASEIENGNAADPDAQAKNLSVSIAPSNLRSWKTDVQELFSGGLLTRTAIAGTPVAGYDQTDASGAWAFDTFIELEGQNSDGSKPTINSVTGGTDGALVLDTDYVIVKAAGGWGIMILDSATVTTEDQDIVTNYDYTPAAGSTLTFGTNSKILDYVQVRLRHYTESDFSQYDYEVIFYRVRPDAGGIVMTKSGALSGNELDEWTIALTAEADDSLPDGAQIYTLYQGDPIAA